MIAHTRESRAGLHLSIHAIGDKANHLLLDAYERLIQVNGKQDRRLRIEHAQHLRYIHGAAIALSRPLIIIRPPNADPSSSDAERRTSCVWRRWA
jgi:hypothetical protein